MKKYLFSKGPPFENCLEFWKLPIFNAFTKYAVVSTFFEIQTSPICQIKWFYKLMWDLDGEWLPHLHHHLPHDEPLVVRGRVHEVCCNFQNPHPFFPVIYVWGLIWDIVFYFLTTNKETTPNVTPPSKFVGVWRCYSPINTESLQNHAHYSHQIESLTSILPTLNSNYLFVLWPVLIQVIYCLV